MDVNWSHGWLRGRTVVVTGGTRGIGRATALAAAEMGADVVTLSRAAAPEITAALQQWGGRPLGLTCDVRDDDAVTAARDAVLDHTGRIDALVNNAGGLVAPRRPFWEYDADEFDAVIDWNLRSAFVCAREFSEPMRNAASGRIVNVGSDGVGKGLPGLTHYLAAKAGLVGLTRGLAVDLGPFGIGVNAVSPGLTVGESNVDVLTDEHRSGAAASQLLARNLVPDDIAGAIVFLCSPAASMITGQTLQINGGATMGPT
jgi:3-oxoacyl-[acyl-carrier protein] reductase